MDSTFTVANDRQPVAPLPTAGDREGIAALRVRFDELAFGTPSITTSVEPREQVAQPPGDVALHLRRLPRGEPLSTLIKLFVLGVAVRAEEAAAAFAPLPVERVAAFGIIEVGDEVRGLVLLHAYDGLVLASDRAEELARPDANPDHVGNINPTSLTLDRLTVRQRVDAALDVGTGCGVQALLAARHAGRVVATDVNHRALAYTAFNALLNGFENVECRQGSFFEPIVGERFDLVVSNPPFVVSPDMRFTLRDAEAPADEVCQQVVAGAAAVLAEGGFATVLASWGRRRDEEWRAAPSAWVEGNGCDAWLLHHRSQDPLDYAASWNRLLRTTDPTAYAATLDRWVEYDAGLGYDALEYGAILLRRRVGSGNWIRADKLPETASRAGDHVLRVFAAQDLLDGLGDDRDLFGLRLALVEEHAVQQTLRRRHSAFAADRSLLRLEAGLPFEGVLDPVTLELLARLDGKHTLGDVLAAVARAHDSGPESFEEGTLRVVRRLLELGFLEPVATA